MMQRFTDWHPLGNNQACVCVCVCVLVLEWNDHMPVNSSEEDLFTLQHEWRGSSARRHVTLMSLEQNRSRSDRRVLQDQECVCTQAKGRVGHPPLRDSYLLQPWSWLFNKLWSSTTTRSSFSCHCSQKLKKKQTENWLWCTFSCFVNRTIKTTHHFSLPDILNS